MSETATVTRVILEDGDGTERIGEMSYMSYLPGSPTAVFVGDGYHVEIDDAYVTTIYQGKISITGRERTPAGRALHRRWTLTLLRDQGYHAEVADGSE